ncbi:MAG: response regulator, partial [Planctomycetaceae bacterium]|nr:response regulator [Planctomycetaceae bacterium]
PAYSPAGDAKTPELYKRLDTPANLTVTLKDHRVVFDLFQRPMQRLNRWAANRLADSDTAYDLCTQSITVHWQSVQHATVYHLQWNSNPGDEHGWLDIYTGSQTSCELNLPAVQTVFLRVRAEDGTPYDDPIYANLMKVCDVPVTANQDIAYAYTLRQAEDGSLYFVACPSSDANHNGKIDLNERPAGIGEIYPPQPLFTYVAREKKEGMGFISDEWGHFFTVAVPIYAPDGSFDGIFAFDFSPDIVYEQLFKNHFYAYLFFVAVGCIYFSGVWFLAKAKVFGEEQQHLARELQMSIVEVSTAQKVAEDASMAKTVFLTNMSHELRTPLNAILGFTDVFGRKLMTRCLPEEQTECSEAIHTIKDSGKHLLSIIQDVLQISALDEGAKLKLTFVPMNLPELIHRIAGELRSSAENKFVQLTITDNGTLPHWIWNDPAHIRQVLVHLITNAIKFTPSGAVEITYGTVPPPDDAPASGLTGGSKYSRIAAAQKQRQMMFVSVADTGIGIETELIEAIFKPFVQADATLTRQFGGTGIGLSIAKRVAKMLDGDITVESRVGIGSTFSFTFPAQIVQCTDCPKRSMPDLGVAPKPSSIIVTRFDINKVPDSLAKAKNRQKSADACPPSAVLPSAVLPFVAPQPLNDKNILIVDDSKINQMVFSAALREAGCRIELAKDGQEGVEKATAALNGGDPFDVILMDMQMPVMDGYEATRTLRMQDYTKPIIAVTAHALPDDQAKCLDAGCDAYLSKPVEPHLLQDTLKSFINLENA